MFGTMYHWHKRGFFGTDLSRQDSEYVTDLVATIEREGGIIVPVFLYEHSGQTISAAPFSCPWDSGKVGFWAATGAQIKAEFDGDKDKARACIISEIKTMDHYLRGNVYGFTIEDGDEQVDSCWGFIGDYDDEHGCLAEARSNADYHVKAEQTARLRRLRTMIEKRVPLHVREAELGGCHVA